MKIKPCRLSKQLDSVTENPFVFCDYKVSHVIGQNTHSRNIFSVHGFLNLSVKIWITCFLKGQSHGDFLIFFLTILINLYQSTLLIHELLLDHKGTILNEFSKKKNKPKLVFKYFIWNIRQKLEKFCQKFSSRTPFPSWPSVSRHTFYSFHVLDTHFNTTGPSFLGFHR